MNILRFLTTVCAFGLIAAALVVAAPNGEEVKRPQQVFNPDEDQTSEHITERHTIVTHQYRSEEGHLVRRSDESNHRRHYVEFEQQSKKLQEKLRGHKQKYSKKKASKAQDKFMASSAEEADEDMSPPLDFLPAFIGSIKQGETVTGKGRCFNKISARMDIDGNGSVVVKLDVSDKEHFFCHEWFLFSTLFHTNPHWYILSGRHTIELRGLNEAEMEDVQRHGVRLFHIHDDFVDTIKSVWQTLKMVVPKIAGGDEKETILNKEFLEENTDLRFPERANITWIPDKKDVKTGDVIFCQGMTGIDIFILWMTGAKVTHTAMAMWIGNELHVIESAGGGIVKSTWEKFHSDRQKMGMGVVLLPLKEKVRKNLSEKKMVQFFNQSEGLAYGTYNLLFTLLDTHRGNLPAPLSMEMMEVLFLTLEPLLNPVVKLAGMGDLWTSALNMRLGTSGKSTRELYTIMSERGLSFSQVVTSAEKDEWIYPEIGPSLKGKTIPAGHSMICSSFACEVLKSGGLFSDLEKDIQCTEFNTQDIYELNIFFWTGVRQLS